ncbi:MAG: hypothetical protein Q7T89_01945 [Anaerolineales bacterium]|nr:hypothetical protein [Anaerolineales bacterium]
MKYFFRQVEDIPLDNSPVSAEIYFRGANATGLIEKQVNADRAAVLLFISGEPSMAYLLENGQSKSISLAEFLSLNDGIGHPRAINLPDVAGRLMLLALESQAENKFSIADDEAWKKQVNQWKQDQWDGLVEITSKNLHGFTLFWQGEPQKSDLIFSTPQGFVSGFPTLNNADDSAWNVTTYSHPVSTQAYQCTVLRQGATYWCNKILNRYQEMVGQKLLQMMDRELNRQMQPWHWNITLAENDMLDMHFFPYLMDAAHAYRALFMAMGAQMNFVIGNNLTQRLLSETFEQVPLDERVALQSQRLIPAAFSE